MAILTHPSAVSHFDQLLYAELRITGDLMVSLLPVLKNITTTNIAIRELSQEGIDFPADGFLTMSKALEQLSEVLAERSDNINYYRSMGSFSVQSPS
jgi:hypothetical protein